MSIAVRSSSVSASRRKSKEKGENCAMKFYSYFHLGYFSSSDFLLLREHFLRTNALECLKLKSFDEQFEYNYSRKDLNF